MPFGFYWDPSMFLLIPPLLLSIWAQWKTSSTFRKYSEMPSRRGTTAEEVASVILRSNGVNNVRIEMVPGNLTDHYDPRSRVLRLSESVYGQTSIAALGVAAHEAGHAIQHAQNYGPIQVRNAIFPVVNIASNLSWFVFAAGLFMGIQQLAWVGIALFSGAFLFSVITLPVEFNASRRAVAVLDKGAFLAPDELKGAKSVLSAAALTYVAAALMSLMQLLRMVFIARDRD